MSSVPSISPSLRRYYHCYKYRTCDHALGIGPLQAQLAEHCTKFTGLRVGRKGCFKKARDGKGIVCIDVLGYKCRMKSYRTSTLFSVVLDYIAGSIPSRRPKSCIFRNWFRLDVKMYDSDSRKFTFNYNSRNRLKRYTTSITVNDPECYRFYFQNNLLASILHEIGENPLSCLLMLDFSTKKKMSKLMSQSRALVGNPLAQTHESVNFRQEQKSYILVHCNKHVHIDSVSCFSVCVVGFSLLHWTKLNFC